MELVSSRDEFPFLISVHPISYLLSPLSSLSPSLLSPLSSLLSPMWQKLPYIYNNFFYYNNLSITFLNYCTIEKSPLISHVHVHVQQYNIISALFLFGCRHAAANAINWPTMVMFLFFMLLLFIFHNSNNYS